MTQPSLNLPPCEVKLQTGADGKERIWDPLRGKWVPFTPEEYVRRRFTAYLIEKLHYPSALMANEVSLTLNGLHRRADTLVYDREGRPFMVVEYKAPSVNINQRVFDQAVKYNLVYRAPYIVVSNGMNHYCCHIDIDNSTYQFVPQIPDWQRAMLGAIDN